MVHVRHEILKIYLGYHASHLLVVNLLNEVDCFPFVDMEFVRVEGFGREPLDHEGQNDDAVHNIVFFRLNLQLIFCMSFHGIDIHFSNGTLRSNAGI